MPSALQFFLHHVPAIVITQPTCQTKQSIPLPSFVCFSIVRSGDAIYVRVGDHDLTQKYGSPGAQTLRVSTTYIHHNHNSQTLDNDIALLKLHGQAELKDGVCLVCLPARGVSQAAGKRCTVTGYGYMGEGKEQVHNVRASWLLECSDCLTVFILQTTGDIVQ
jgi:hypothetical protein